MSAAPGYSAASRGAFAAACAFLLWGLTPIYWKQIDGVSAFELIPHRIVWSLVFLLGVMAWRKSFAELRPAFTDAGIFFNSLVAGLLLSVNWSIYVWAVNSGHIIESSLGYFLTPLCNVALGFFFLHERLRPMQWAAIGLAAAGVGLVLLRAGHVPWIALSLAGSWSLYGIFKKRSQLGSIAGLTAETLMLAPFAAGLILWQVHLGTSVLGHTEPEVFALIAGTGVVTAVPLLLFAYGAQRLRLATIGVFQYIAPSVQFLIGLLVYEEPFDSVRLQACLLIWFGLAIYTADSLWAQRSRLRSAGSSAANQRASLPGAFLKLLNRFSPRARSCGR